MLYKCMYNMHPQYIHYENPYRIVILVSLEVCPPWYSLPSLAATCKSCLVLVAKQWQTNYSNDDTYILRPTTAMMIQQSGLISV